MAVDTRARRQSAHRVANPWARGLPNADDTVAQADRQHVLGYYGGILAGVAAVVAAVGKYAAQHARAYAQIKAAADASYSDAHARAYAQILKAGV